MNEWIRSGLDILLIIMVGLGLAQAMRLIKHLSGLKAGRIEMEKFVHEFGATISRAEMGVKHLRQAARESGDDLEKLVDKAHLIRDELQFIVESADTIAERLSQAASAVVRTPAPKPAPEPVAKAQPPAPPQAEPASRAEKELLQALQKLS